MRKQVIDMKRVTFAEDVRGPERPRAPGDASRKRRRRSKESFADSDGSNDDLSAAVVTRADETSLVHDTNPAEVAVTAFNMEDELNDGYIEEEAGYFVPTALRSKAMISPTNSVSSSDDDKSGQDIEGRTGVEERDDWITREEDESYPAAAYSDETDESRSRQPKRARLQDGVSSSPDSSDAAAVHTKPAKEALIFEIVRILQPGETPAAALRRFKKEGRLEQLERTTELCDGLMASGLFGIYEERRAQITEYVQWYLRWGSIEGPKEVHGPFTVSAMRSWGSSGYFSNSCRVGWVSTAADGPCMKAEEIFV